MSEATRKYGDDAPIAPETPEVPAVPGTSSTPNSKSPLLPRRESSIKFKQFDPHQDQQETYLLHAAHDMFDALIDDTIDDEELDEDALWLREQRMLNKTLHWLRRPSLFMIGFAIFLFSFASITGESSRQILTFKLACNGLIRDSDKGYCEPTNAEVILSHLKATTTVVCNTISLIAMTKVGQLSDQYGRKPFIFFIAFCLFVARSFEYYLMTHYNYLRFWLMIFLESFLSIAGGLLTFVSLFNCYLSDIAEVHERSFYLGVGMAFFYVGISLGPIASNFVRSISKNLRGSLNLKLTSEKAFNVIEDYEYDPLRFELGLLLLMMFFTMVILPESRPEKARKKSRSLSMTRLQESMESESESGPRDQPLSHSHVHLYSQVQTIYYKLLDLPKKLIKFLISYFKPISILLIPKEFKPLHFSDERFKRERLAVIGLVILDSALSSISGGVGEIYILYGILKLHWSSTEIGIFLAISCAARAIVLVVISPLVNHYIYHRMLRFKVMSTQFDMPDFVTIFIGVMAEAIVLAVYPFVTKTRTFFIVLCFSGLGSLSIPSINSAIVKYYPDAKTGELFSALSVVKALCGLIVPIVLLTLYNISITKLNFPGFVFLFLSFCFFLWIILLIVIKQLLGLHSKSSQEVLTRSNSFMRSRSSSISQGNYSPNVNGDTSGDNRQTSYFDNNFNSTSNANTSLSMTLKDPVDPLARTDSFDSSKGARKNSITELHRKNSNISQYRVNRSS